ncbi:hypothetical protein QOZ80_7BG0586270 [Eleusine coracana subsp. coracana]|nr:hypothetical protein QOZ80_7BG0586270 [Eleusine coracana subsp. coracana]
MDFYSDDSDPDLDADLQEDLDALRRSCILSGADPDAAIAQLSSAAGASSSYLTGPSTPAVSASAAAPAAHDFSDDDEEDEDLALVRSIRESLRLTRASPPPDAGDGGAQPRPICVWPPSDTDDDDEDDLETLRAIQRRFSHYQSGTSTSSTDNLKPEAPLGARSSECFVNEPEEDLTVQKESVKDGSPTGFPQAALLLVDALKKNRACQKLIRRKMVNIEAKIEENKDLRDRVKCLMGYQLSCRKSVGKLLCQKEDPRVRLISSRKPTVQSAKNKYKKMPALFLGPAENLHVSKYKMVLKQFPMSLQKQPWLDAEKDKLARGIKQQYQETLILNSMNNGSAVDMAYALTNSASNFEVTPESLRSVLPLINWDKIAAMYLPGRSGAECESRWLNCDDPLINQNAWTKHEEKRLLYIVQQKGMCDWINIAATLGTQRTPFQCLVRYQRSLNPHIINKVWTKEEDLRLKAAVETFGDNWQLISAKLDGRTGSQCSNRWRKTLNPEKTGVGRWSLEEDKCLMVAVKLFGSGSWSRIAQFVPGRMQSQCRERWCDVLDPDLDHREWQPEEDSKLLAAVDELGPVWSKIAGKIIPRRSDNMCMSRWKRLCKDKLPAIQATKQIKKAIFQSNFVDREKERPAISPDDLLALVHSQNDRHEENTTRGESEKQMEDAVAVSDGLNNSSKGRKRSRKKKSTPDNNVTVQNITMGSIPVDNEAVPTELREIISTDIGAEENRTREAVSPGEERVVKKRKRASKSVANDGAVRKRMRGSIPVGNDTVPAELMGTISTSVEAGTSRMMDPVSIGEEGVVKKRTRRTNSVGNEGAVRTRRSNTAGSEGVATKRMRGSISVDNEAIPVELRGIISTDIDAGTDSMMDPVSVGEEGVAKKRRRRTNSNSNEGFVRKRRGSTTSGEENTERMKVRGSVSVESNGAVKRRKRASARKSAEDSSISDDITIAIPELGLPSVPSEERVIDDENLNKGKRKSTPRPKQINMAEGNADRRSTCVRLANCLSFARMNGTNRSKI